MIVESVVPEAAEQLTIHFFLANVVFVSVDNAFNQYSAIIQKNHLLHIHGLVYFSIGVWVTPTVVGKLCPPSGHITVQRHPEQQFFRPLFRCLNDHMIYTHTITLEMSEGNESTEEQDDDE